MTAAPYEHTLNPYSPESLDRLRQTRGLDLLHAGPTGREVAAFRAAVATAQHPTNDDGAGGPPAGILSPAGVATSTPTPSSLSLVSGGVRG